MGIRKKRRLRVGTFNLLYGRNHEVVRAEVIRACQEYNLDVLVVQEAAGYAALLDHIPGYKYYTNWRGKLSDRQVGILVHNSVTVTGKRFLTKGDGWYTEGGAYHGPVTIPIVRILGGLRIAGWHLPTPTVWKRGKLIGPPNRVDDYKAAALWAVGWLKPKRMVIGDMNEPPWTDGELTPKDVAKRTGGFISAPSRNLAGHGTIDYLIGNGFRVLNVIEVTDLPEKSDHNLVVYTIEY